MAEAKRPAYILLENVPGLLHHEGGQTFGTILAAFHELGYSLEWSVLNSVHFGVPQQRRRIYIVGFLDERLVGRIFPLTPRNGTDYRKEQKDCLSEGVSVCLTKPKAVEKIDLHFIDMNAEPKVTHEARCITARQDSGISNWKGEHSGVMVAGVKNVLNKPIMTAMDKYGTEYSGILRKITPKECFRLQGYTGEQFDKLVDAGIPKSQLYKMAGNSVTTHVVTAIGLELIQEIKKLEVKNA